ncbi:Trp biosynthesis-associated membrane protein [Allorhizocola rhizosphaerae]|uniref:Trp biosynthesis-associated membrane protein n=1 Tax=Allorhizocola rhizosphaerae TaxID=1872709 RepID=UPI0013C33D2C|nr:Trp biosynthesis-associated membrane protein [Allorhizocola rhizosphaerae]
MRKLESRSRLIALALSVLGAGAVWFNPADDLASGTRAASLVVLAGAGALLAGRGVVFRRLVSIVIVLAGIGLTLGGTAPAIVGGVLAVIGGSIAVVASPGWPVMGPRYERPVKEENTDLWAALDRGEDPTATH